MKGEGGMTRLKIIKNMIDKNTGVPYRKGSIMTVVDSTRIKELIDAKVAVEIRQSKKETNN